MNDNVQLNFESDNAIWYSVGIYKDGKRDDSIWDVTENTELTTDSFFNYGDINLDKKISISDTVLLNKYLVNSAVLTDTQLKYADCNKDGKVDTSDTLMILKFIVGTYDRLPINFENQA